MLPHARNIAVIAILWLAGLLAGMQFAKISVLLPEIRALYPMHSGQIAWLLTLVSIVGAVFGGLAGGFANRFGLKRFLVLSLLAAGGLSLWQSTYPPFALMTLSRILEGVSHLGIVVTAPALMAQISAPRWRGATMALWSTFFGVSFAIFAWFGIPRTETLQVSGLFQLHGYCALVIAGLTIVLLRVPVEETEDAPQAQGFGSSMRAAYTAPKVVWAGVGWLFYTLTFLALLTILPADLPDSLRQQTTTALSLLGIATSLLLVPLLLLAFRATTVVMLGFVLAIVATLLGTGMEVLVLGVALFAILGVVQGGTFAAVAQLNPSTATRTLGYGFMAQTGNLGNLIGTPVLLFAMNAAGADALLLTTSAIYGLGLLCLVTVFLRIRRTQ